MFSEEQIILYCAPTLADLKTGSIFCCSFLPEEIIQDIVLTWNKTYQEKGIRIVLLRENNNRALLYLFRPGRLIRDLKQIQVRSILSACGYTGKTMDELVTELVIRIRIRPQFPTR